MAMIGGLAAVGLAPGLGSTGGAGGGAPIADDDGDGGAPTLETPTGLVSFEAPEKTIDVTRSYNAVISTDAGDIVVALNPDAPAAANSFAFLAGQNFYDGLEFYWVFRDTGSQTAYAQAGDPTCGPEEATCTGAGGPGYTLSKEGEPGGAGPWSVIAPVTTQGGDQVHGSIFVIALTDAEVDGTPFGEVVEGQEILESLERRVPCFGSAPSDSNPCQVDGELPAPLTIMDVIVQPA